MLARLQRSLAFVPSRVTRLQFSTTVQRAKESQDVDADSTNDLDKAFDWEKPSSTSTSTSEPSPESSSESQEPSAFNLLSTSEPRSNGLSYAGLPEHKIFLDIPAAEDPLIRYLASSLLRDGRRHSAERRASRCLLHLHTLTRADPLPLLRTAVEKVMPSVRIARHKHSTKIIEIPVALNAKQQVRYAMKWMLKASDLRGGRTVEERLAREIVLVLNGSSKALGVKATLHQNATVNRGNIPVGRSSF